MSMLCLRCIKTLQVFVPKEHKALHNQILLLLLKNNKKKQIYSTIQQKS